MIAAVVLALQLVADPVPAGTMPGATPPAPGSPRFVQLVSLVGLPADSGFADPFAAGFRATFAEAEFAGERLTRAGEWKPVPAFSNRFRLLQGDAAEDAWKLEVSIGAPPPAVGSREGLVYDPNRGYHPGKIRTVAKKFRSSRGMIVGFTLAVPDASGHLAEPRQLSCAFYFPAAPTDGASPAVPTGYRYPWGTAGRIAALLVLDALHHESGDLAVSERLDIGPGVRVAAGAERGVSP